VPSGEPYGAVSGTSPRFMTKNHFVILQAGLRKSLAAARADQARSQPQLFEQLLQPVLNRLDDPQPGTSQLLAWAASLPFQPSVDVGASVAE
jgi:hypothetical protein